MCPDDASVCTVITCTHHKPHTHTYCKHHLPTIHPPHALLEAVEARGGLYLEAPVGGSKKPAQDGKLVVMAAGNRALFEQVVPLMDIIGKKTYFLGV